MRLARDAYDRGLIRNLQDRVQPYMPTDHFDSGRGLSAARGRGTLRTSSG